MKSIASFDSGCIQTCMTSMELVRHVWLTLKIIYVFESGKTILPSVVQSLYLHIVHTFLSNTCSTAINTINLNTIVSTSSLGLIGAQITKKLYNPSINNYAMPQKYCFVMVWISFCCYKMGCWVNTVSCNFCSYKTWVTQQKCSGVYLYNFQEIQPGVQLGKTLNLT